VGNDGLADVAVNTDLGEGRSAKYVADGGCMPGCGQAQQLLVTIGEMVVLVIRDHSDRGSDVLVAASVFAQHAHLLRRTLLGDPAVRKVRDDVALSQLLVPRQLIVRQADPSTLEQHRVVGLGGDGHRFEAPLAQQRIENASVLVLVGTVPGNLSRHALIGLRYERRDPAVLPAALRLAAGCDRAEQLKRLVVVENIIEDCARREHL
jgi:hypothetical protein